MYQFSLPITFYKLEVSLAYIPIHLVFQMIYKYVFQVQDEPHEIEGYWWKGKSNWIPNCYVWNSFLDSISHNKNHSTWIAWIFSFFYDQFCLHESPLNWLDYKEGSFMVDSCIRIAFHWVYTIGSNNF